MAIVGSLREQGTFIDVRDGILEISANVLENGDRDVYLASSSGANILNESGKARMRVDGFVGKVL